MAAFRLTKLAKQDIKSIGRYTQATWGREQRNRYLAQLDTSFQRLANQPQLGKACDEICVGYRKYPVGRHIVFYKESATGIDVIRVLHDRMDIETQLDD